MTFTGLRARLALAPLALSMLVVAPSVPSAQQRSGPSDLTVSRLVDYTWSVTPAKFTTPDARTILIDKSNPNDMTVGREAAVEIIGNAYRSYEAELCGLAEEAVANFQTLMARVKRKYNLTDQQYVFAIQLHTVTVQYTKGGIRITGDDKDKKVELLNIPPRDPKECSDERRKRVAAAVTSYIKQDPAPPIQQAPPKKAESVPATQKK
jgi:hypothetical protein